MTDFFIGVDGGGTHTRVVVADADGHELGSSDGAASAVRPGRASHSAEIIEDLIRRACAAGNVSGRARCLCVGVAGVGRGEEREALLDALDALAVADDVLVLPDAMIALEDAFGEGAGILLVAGTGSIALGRGPTGTVTRCGGWGPVCGDEGSGAWLGQRALGVVTAAHDGREPETGLTGGILLAAGVDHVEGLIAWAARATPADLASLAPTVMEVAATGDLRAGSVVALAVEELALHIRTLARLLFSDERASFPLAFSGGLIPRGALLRKRLEHRLKTMTPGAQLRADAVVPVRGAVKHALRNATAVPGQE